MVNHGKAWAIVWIIIVAVIAFVMFPSGQSTILFGFWPSNALILVLVGIGVAIIGALFGYDMMYNVYPERETIVEGGET